jgi:hypothetical protein
MTSRPANGRYELTRGFDADYIPATPGFPGPTRRLPVVADRVSGFDGINPRDTPRDWFEPETREWHVDLRHCQLEKTSYNALLAAARAKYGEPSRVILYACQDTLFEQMPEFTYNGFVRQGAGQVPGTPQFKLVQEKPCQWKCGTPRVLTLEEKAAFIKSKAMEEQD